MYRVVIKKSYIDLSFEFPHMREASDFMRTVLRRSVMDEDGSIKITTVEYIENKPTEKENAPEEEAES